MKITCLRESLQMACQLVSVAVPAATTIPALKNLKATAQDDALFLVAYDPTQGIGIRYELRGVSVARAGSCILPKDQFIDILRESSESEISIDAGKDAVVAKAGGGRFEMLKLDVEEFPDIPAFDAGGHYHEVSAGSLRTLIKRTAFAADKKDTTAKFALSGVLWETDANKVRLVATDTKRLAIGEGPATIAGTPDDVKAVHLIPLKTIHLLERSLTDDNELVRVALRTNDALFQTERAMIYTSLVQGKFPPYRDIVSKTRKDATQTIPLPVAAFLSRVRQAAIMTDEESKRVDLTFAPGQLTLEARGANTGSSRVALELPEYSGPEWKIAFDPQFLIEFLRALDSEPTAILEASSGNRAALFRCGEDYLYLVMPLVG